MSLPIFLKWAGGKAQSLSRIDPHIPTEMSNYYEPFLGGGSVLIHVLSSLKSGTRTLLPGGEIIAADINAALINVYKVVQCDPEALIEELQGLADRAINSPSFEEYYYALRYLYNENKAEFNLVPRNVNVETAAYFIYLNHNGFRGLYRENKSGDFNVPYGHYDNPEIINKSHLDEIHELIQGVIFRCCDFTASMSTIETNDFVYLDPPYAPETVTSFVKYTESGFALEKHKLLFETIHSLPIKMMMSNADVSLVRENFTNCGEDKKYTVNSILCKRKINSKNPDAKALEVIIRNYNN